MSDLTPAYKSAQHHEINSKDPMRCHDFYRLVTGVLMFGMTATGSAQEADSRWQLRIENLEHDAKVDATIRFTGADADGYCMAGKWKQLAVESTTTQNEAFFPIAEPLTYEVDRGVVTLGRTSICDGYLFLSGKSNAENINGTYDAASLGGSREMGYFSLKKIH